jgi:hypothetical protein
VHVRARAVCTFVPGRLAIASAVFVASAIVAATLTASAPAFQDYTTLVSYCGDCYLAPGQGTGTVNLNYRTENGGCRKDGAGYNEFVYFNANNVIVVRSGVVRTACNEYDGIRHIDSPNGYYKSGCANAGVQTHLMYCYTWNYTP